MTPWEAAVSTHASAAGPLEYRPPMYVMRVRLLLLLLVVLAEE
jgi:hypothetical protein